MTLADHLRELRYRLIVVALAIIIAASLAAIWYEQLYAVMMHPYQLAVEMLNIRARKKTGPQPAGP